ncbi:hypothetical protein M409DRAFT_53308 [Zasmidium cellare ATCC 36951]|uniref:Transcription factor domain-containing protein n=1 Tax=Zasmidium cellare ATCC 36951 TaxID=1080233 RepID=A0A6A6CPS2_ZASCE|nr:uncharacterized protein M409DRAFT_53308 [Zasmidium cellare ATCC 36951]KAF2168673.1 hypothetical protein M409DRAFT_53308 [Zasmidium cellare ATCC 36951]
MRFSEENRCRPCRDSRKKVVILITSQLGGTDFLTEHTFGTIHVENKYASKELSRPRGARRTAEKSPLTTSGIGRDVVSEAIAYYVKYYLGSADVPTSAMSDLRKAVLCTTQCIDVMEAALSAAALAVFERVRCQQRVAFQAATYYQRALQALQTALLHIGEDDVGACLLAIFFMARYEDSIFEQGQNSAQRPVWSQSHHTGVIAVLEHWINMHQAPQQPTFSVTYARRMLSKAALLGHIDLPNWLEDGSAFGETGSRLSLDDMLVRLIALRKSMENLQTKERSLANSQAAEVLEREAMSIDRALLGWEYVCMKPKEFDEAGAKAAEEVRWYGYRMMTCRLRMQAMELLAPNSRNGLATHITEVSRQPNALAEGLRSAISSYLDRCLSRDYSKTTDGKNMCFTSTVRPYDSEEIVHPLMIALTTPYIDSRFVELFRTQLQHVGRSTGYGLVLAIASSPK